MIDCEKVGQEYGEIVRFAKEGEDEDRLGHLLQERRAWPASGIQTEQDRAAFPWWGDAGPKNAEEKRTEAGMASTSTDRSRPT